MAAAKTQPHSTQSRTWTGPPAYPVIPDDGQDCFGMRPSDCLLCTWYGGRLKYISRACSVHGILA